jgi:hypothetical protein
MCNNSTPSPTTLTGGLSGYALTTGYDLPTGLGSLDVSKYINAAASVVAATVTVTATPTAINTSQTVVLKATVASTTTGTPTGTVVFTSNGATIATVTLSGGVATTSALSFTTPGTDAIIATYSGDTTFLAATGSYSLVVMASGTTKSTSTLAATATTATAAQTIGLTATIAGSGGTPTGTVQFTLDGAKYGTAVTVSGGTATVAPALFAYGTHAITCAYSGDNTFAASTCNTVTLTISSLASSTSITINPSTVGTSGTTTISSMVTSVSGGPTPTGKVTLFNATTNATYASLSLTNGSVSGTLTVSQVPLAVGTYQLQMVYSGDSAYSASTSPNGTLVVTMPTVSMSANPATLSQNAGGSSSAAVTVTSFSFSGTQSLTCAVTFNGPGTATDIPSCSFSPSTLSFTGSGTLASTLTVYSTAASAVNGGVYRSENRRLEVTGMGGAAFAGLLLLCLPRRGRRAVKAARLLIAMLFLGAGFVTLSGCGSGGTSSNPGTTKGSYDVNINANSAIGQAANVGYSTYIPLSIN